MSNYQEIGVDICIPILTKMKQFVKPGEEPKQPSFLPTVLEINYLPTNRQMGIVLAACKYHFVR